MNISANLHMPYRFFLPCAQMWNTLQWASTSAYNPPTMRPAHEKLVTGKSVTGGATSVAAFSVAGGAVVVTGTESTGRRRAPIRRLRPLIRTDSGATGTARAALTSRRKVRLLNDGIRGTSASICSKSSRMSFSSSSFRFRAELLEREPESGSLLNVVCVLCEL